MKRFLLVVLAALLLVPSAAATAADIEKISPASFIVNLDAANRTVEVIFALALSQVSTYPVTITAIGSSAEEVLWQGTLDDGIYRVRAPLTKIASGPLKIILKTKVVNRIVGGADAYLVYLKWEGSL